MSKFINVQLGNNAMENGPSTTGEKSGGGRDNNPPRGK
ncbi:MAG: hypothetical protein ACJAWI_002379 [Marinomonas primoryensis]|jgi:hypothetical protein